MSKEQCANCRKELTFWKNFSPKFGKEKGKKFCNYKCSIKVNKKKKGKKISGIKTKEEFKERRLELKTEIREINQRIMWGWIGIIISALTVIFLILSAVGLFFIFQIYKERDELQSQLDQVESK